MRRALLILTGVVVVAAAGSAPAKNDSTPIFEKVGAALNAHGIEPCDAPDWVTPLDENGEKRSGRLRTRFVHVLQPQVCPLVRGAGEAYIDWSRRVAQARDGIVTVEVYKSSERRQRAVKRNDLAEPLSYSYGKTTIVGLDNTDEVPELEAALAAAMTDLKARRVFEMK
jgi:hypothetical protein